MSDKRTKTNSERIHRPGGQDRSSRVAPRARAVERVTGTAFPQFLRTFTLAFGVIAGAAAPSLVESPRGLSPPGAPRSVREPLDSYGSRCSAVSMTELPVGEECWIDSA